MKNDKYKKDLDEIDKVYRFRMNLAWAFLGVVLLILVLSK